MTQVKLYLAQLDNGWVIQDESGNMVGSVEVALDKDVYYQLGKCMMSNIRAALYEAKYNDCELDINIKPVDSRLNKTTEA